DKTTTNPNGDKTATNPDGTKILRRQDLAATNLILMALKQ
ncbi:12156_t:CDS:1, partial [Gigaspora rosea]